MYFQGLQVVGVATAVGVEAGDDTFGVAYSLQAAAGLVHTDLARQSDAGVFRGQALVENKKSKIVPIVFIRPGASGGGDLAVALFAGVAGHEDPGDARLQVFIGEDLAALVHLHDATELLGGRDVADEDEGPRGWHDPLGARVDVAGHHALDSKFGPHQLA